MHLYDDLADRFDLFFTSMFLKGTKFSNRTTWSLCSTEGHTVDPEVSSWGGCSLYFMSVFSTQCMCTSDHVNNGLYPIYIAL
jgi:hypothetical protein